MSGLDIFAWIVLGALFVSALVIWFVLAILPGRIARNRGHPQADAINICGWLGALALGIFWPVALIWAFTKSGIPKAKAEAENTLSEERLKAFEARLNALEERRTPKAEAAS